MPAPWSFGGSPTTSTTLQLGVERRRHLCAGDVETPSFVEKLLSGTRGQGDRGDLQALVATQEETRERLGGREAKLFMSASTT